MSQSKNYTACQHREHIVSNGGQKQHQVHALGLHSTAFTTHTCNCQGHPVCLFFSAGRTSVFWLPPDLKQKIARTHRMPEPFRSQATTTCTQLEPLELVTEAERIATLLVHLKPELRCVGFAGQPEKYGMSAKQHWPALNGRHHRLVSIGRHEARFHELSLKMSWAAKTLVVHHHVQCTGHA